MTRSENDLRAALHQVASRADQHGAPSTETILAAARDDRAPGRPTARLTHVRRWLPPLATAAAVAAATVTVVTLTGGRSGADHTSGTPAGASSTLASPSTTTSAAPSTGAEPSIGVAQPSASATASTVEPEPSSAPAIAAGILEAAAARLAAKPWTAPAADQFFYVHTTDATTWTSVSGTRAGYGRTADGGRIWVEGCDHGQVAPGSGSAGSCTMDQVPSYLADAPTTPSAWDAYLEAMAPGAANAQGKIIVQVLHQDLVSPQAAAALLRYTETCPGLHTLDVAPVDGEALVGVTCTSMSNGSYGLAFDATTHAFVGYVPVDYRTGKPTGAAEIVLATGIVSKVEQTP